MWNTTNHQGCKNFRNMWRFHQHDDFISLRRDIINNKDLTIKNGAPVRQITLVSYTHFSTNFLGAQGGKNIVGRSDQCALQPSLKFQFDLKIGDTGKSRKIHASSNHCYVSQVPIPFQQTIMWYPGRFSQPFSAVFQALELLHDDMTSQVKVTKIWRRFVRKSGPQAIPFLQESDVAVRIVLGGLGAQMEVF